MHVGSFQQLLKDHEPLGLCPRPAEAFMMSCERARAAEREEGDSTWDKLMECSWF